MAILKHLAIKKKDYGDIQRYLVFKCEEGTHKPIRDKNGKMVQRDFYIMAGMNCEPFNFDAECVKANQRFQKNNKRDDIMAHHYIISFDPKDAPDHGLTPEKAHQLAREFAEYFFDGHQVLIVTHADGNNHSGNIHTHIVLNSLRVQSVEKKPFMEHGRDSMAGYKHHLTDALLHRMHERLQEICEREHLYTVEVGMPSERKVSEREYQARQRGQKELDEVNEGILEEGFKPSNMTFETVKQQIRSAVDEAVSKAKSEEEFKDILSKRCKIEVIFKRGRISYKHPESNKPYTARSLGNAYERDVILEKIQMNNERGVTNRPEFAELPRIFLIPSDLKLVRDIQSCVKAQQSRAYARKVALSNLQSKAKTLVWLEKNGMASLEKLIDAKEATEARYHESDEALRRVKKELKRINLEIKHVGRYYSNQKRYEQYQRAEDPEAFRAEYRSAIEAFEESVQVLGERFPDGNYPTLKELREQKAALTERRGQLEKAFAVVSADMRGMNIVWKNVRAILGHERTIEREEERARAKVRRGRDEVSL